MTATATTVATTTATTATTVSAPALTVTRTLASGKTRTFSFERALTRASSTERAQLRARVYQSQLTNGQYRPFVSDLLVIFGSKAQNCAFGAGIGAKGAISGEAFQEFVKSFPLSGKETGERAFMAQLIRALRG